MIKPWTYRSTKDKLNIFVSSRLDECKKERGIVKEAIESLNQRPILFEVLGAKPYPPRDLYLSRLRDSQIMVAIYRSGYGYIDSKNGMDISGLEDELINAQEMGVETLVYVYKDNRNRDARLAKMVEGVESGGKHTLAYYEKPEELHGRIRDDLTALISERLLNTADEIGAIEETAKGVLARSSFDDGEMLDRTNVLEDLNSQLASKSVLCVYGPVGIGKTVLVAQFSDLYKGIFVRLSGLAPKDIFSVCANILDGKSTDYLHSYPTLESARSGFLTLWDSAGEVTLVVDECDYIQELIDVISTSGALKHGKRLIFTSIEPSEIYDNFEIPPMVPNEISLFLSKLPPIHAVDLKLLEVGNPLIIQQAVKQSAPHFPPKNLAQLEGVEGEIIRYLALCKTTLSAEDILLLREDHNYSIDALYADISKINFLVDDTPRGFRLKNSEVAELIVEQLQQAPQKLKFYINRLVRLFKDAGELRVTYNLASLLGDGSEIQYAANAAIEAAQLGDWRSGVKLSNQLLAHALDNESKVEAFNLMLMLIYPLELMGDAEQATLLLEKAHALAKEIGSSAQDRLEEAKVSSKARRGISVDDVGALEEIYKRYGENQDFWNQARIGLELSANYIAAKNYEKARDILRPTLESFEEYSDDYGVDLAQRNLASSLSSLPGHEEEAEHLIKQIEGRSRDKSDTRRNRAWYCNIITRRLRLAGRYDQAETLAKEAIEIGESLGDESLKALNLVNLGNCYRDHKKPELATDAYNSASIFAQKCGRMDIEADSSRLMAGVFNDFPQIKGHDNPPSLAKHHAMHAIGLLRDTLNHYGCAWAYFELAEAEESLGDLNNAAQAYFMSAKNFVKSSDESNYGHSLLRASYCALPDNVSLYLSQLKDILGADHHQECGLSEQFISMLSPLIEQVPKGVFIPLLSRHLNEIWSHTPDPLKNGFLLAITNIAKTIATTQNSDNNSWRIFYSGVVFSYLLKDGRHSFLNHRMSQSIAGNVKDVFLRKDEGESLIWTIVLNLGRRVSISISSLDDSPESRLASFALAMFIKAFECDLHQELLGGESSIDELLINITHYDHMPEDTKHLADQNFNMSETLAEQACVVSRPTGFEDVTPIFVFLGSNFLNDISFEEDHGGALQVLFGFTLVELTYQLLRGQVDIEELRPKVVSLVGKTMPSV